MISREQATLEQLTADARGIGLRGPDGHRAQRTGLGQLHGVHDDSIYAFPAYDRPCTVKEYLDDPRQRATVIRGDEAAELLVSSEKQRLAGTYSQYLHDEARKSSEAYDDAVRDDLYGSDD